ncbi:prepilin-type N-terminal cleavage/methylation domain-containing protein [Variovorax paradoxus]|uniref:Prepilin-type N-terminal cleavage/methylation domain-containing protein n=1 Tax=Variovorax paradoxus TaxID=34073 RepID=A0A5Q0MCU2_VARPD|nr:PilW family protein [Variovorax paradoxus]QFZ87153.1 prepilin-type N-terminal cleavage/methylation domain-containing protein [Variovorax paradoxus]
MVHRQRISRGFTLVELMVAITLGLFLLIGLSSLLVSTVSSRSELDKSSRQIDNGRYALQVLSKDIQLAGFVGASSSTAFANMTPVACPTGITDLGYAATTSPGTSSVPLPVYALDSVPSCFDNVMPGTAMLVVTRVSTNAVNVASAASGERYLQVSTCTNDSLPFVAATGSSAASFTLRQKDCLASSLAPLRKIVQHVYFLSTCNACGSDTTPTLKMAEYLNGAMTITPLVEGIENVQFDYGIDMDANGSPDCYTSNPHSPPTTEVAAAVCPQTTPAYDWTAAATNWANVMAIRIHVLARNTEASSGWTDERTYDLGLATPTAGPFNDHVKRHVYSTVARLYNNSGQREVP